MTDIRPIQHLNYLIKPASGLCNMRCRYCFYEDETQKRDTPNAGIMSAQTSEALIRDTFAALNANGSVSFAFQGGEPTLAGRAYFEHFTDLVRGYNTKRVPVSYVLQTNGYGLDESWAELFVREKFLIGISMDGNRAVHDSLRIDAAGAATWERIQRNLAMMQEKGVELNILCVVTKRCAKNPERIYRSLKDLGVRYLQFIPCLDPLGEPRGSLPWSLMPEDYGHFLCGLFDVWYQDWCGGEYTSVRLFDDYVHMAMGQAPGTCATGGSCGSYLVAEADGSLYPCDFYCLDEWKLGGIGEETIPELLYGEKERRFLALGQQHPSECGRCLWVRLCYGGCRRDWVQDGAGNHNYYCSAFRRFFEYAAPRITQIAGEELRLQRRNAGRP